MMHGIMWIWASNDYLKERFHYEERIAQLRWDIWYYYTGVELAITYFMIFCIALGWIFFIFINQKNYIDPFATLKNSYIILNIIFILGLCILNAYFILKGAQSDQREKKLFMILVIAIIFTLISIILFFFINSEIKQNIDILAEYNPNLYANNVLSTLTSGFSNLNYLAPFWIIALTLTISLLFIIYKEIIWLSRLLKKRSALETTEILFDEEENIKF